MTCWKVELVCFPSPAADAAPPQCDVAEELSRQLEDILSTYCRETISEVNGQPHSLALNGLTSEKEDDKQEEGKAASGDSGAEKKTQEKKKVKGLGKDGSNVQ